MERQPETIKLYDFELAALQADSLARDELLVAFRAANIAAAHRLIDANAGSPVNRALVKRFDEAAEILGTGLARFAGHNGHK